MKVISSCGNNGSQRTVWLRPDVQWQHREGRHRNYWIARDPISLRFFTMSEEEHRVLMLLKEPCSTNEFVQRATKISSLKPDAVWLLLHTMVRGGLIRMSMADEKQVRAGGTPATFSSLLSIASWPLKGLSFRIPLGDPTWLLERTRIIGRTSFSSTAVIGLVVAWLLFAAVCLLRWDRLESNVIDAQSGFGWQGFAMFFVAYCILKMAHEFGHALACHRFGAQCRDAGLFFICLVPCFYCDVSDSWKIRSRWRRAWISAAGMYCELWFAVVAGFVWFVSEPGLLQSLSLSMLLIGSVGTLLINGNPLLKFDGYYLLSDLSDVPNLSSQASRAAATLVRRTILRFKVQSPPFDAPILLLAGYHILAWGYRIVAIGLILWSIDYFFGKHRIAQIGQVILYSLITAFVIQWLFIASRQLYQWWRHPFVSRVRLALLVLCIGIASWYLLQTPFTTQMQFVGILTAEQTPVYVTRGGRLVEVLSSDSQVTTGQTLYRLESEPEQLAIAQLETSISELKVKLKYWDAGGAGKVEGAAIRETLAKSLDAMQKRLEALTAEVSQLEGKSPVEGTFIAAKAMLGPMPTIRSVGLADRSVEKSVRMSDGLHLGCELERGTLVGWIVDVDRRYVEAFVDERQVERIGRGMPVRLRLSADPSIEVDGIVEAVRQEPLDQLPSLLRDEFDATTKKLFRVRVNAAPELARSWGNAGNGLRVHLSIRDVPRSLWDRIERFVAASVQ